MGIILNRLSITHNYIKFDFFQSINRDSEVNGITCKLIIYHFNQVCVYNKYFIDDEINKQRNYNTIKLQKIFILHSYLYLNDVTIQIPEVSYLKFETMI